MNILVPVDYSEVSQYAVDVGVDFVKSLNSQDVHRIILTHASKNPEKIDECLEKWSDHCRSIGVRTDHTRINKPLHKGLSDYVDSNDVDLIIIGSHGVSGKSEWFIGSNTQKVVRSVHANVLVVKNQFKVSSINKVAFVTSALQSEVESFERFLKAIVPFNITNIHIVTINQSSFFSEPYALVSNAQEKFADIAKSYNVQSHFYDDYSVESGVRHFVQDWDIDLVGISNHNRHLIKRVIQGSNVELILNHLNVPVLSIDYR